MSTSSIPERATRPGRCPGCGRRTSAGQALFRTPDGQDRTCARCRRAWAASPGWETLRADLRERANQPGHVYLDVHECRALAAQLAPTGAVAVRRGRANRWGRRLLIATALGDKQPTQIALHDAYGLVLDALKHRFNAQMTGVWLGVLLDVIDAHERGTQTAA